MEERLIERLEASVTRLESVSGVASGSPADGRGGEDVSSDQSIKAFDDLMAQHLSRVSSAAMDIGGLVLDVTKIVEEAFKAERNLLVQVKQTQKPDPAGFTEFFKPLIQVIVKAHALVEEHQYNEFINHLKSAAAGINAVAWISYGGKDCVMSMPAAHVEDNWNMAEFYNNKILIQFRNKDPNHVEWAKAMKALYLPVLKDYVKNFYPFGPVWNHKGKKFTPGTSSGPALPGPPPPSNFSSRSPKASSSGSNGGMNAIFQEINSKPVTAGLKKVTADMKTKNRTDRSGVVGASGKETCAPLPSSSSKTKPPKLELQMGRKWVVEYQVGQKELAIDDCDSKKSVYIFGCKDSIIQIKGKVNNITVDKCSKVGVLFTDVVAACEIVNCSRVDVQCQGSAPTISVDNTGGCQIYLSKDSLGASITTAKASEINILVPGPDGDWVEHCMPSQYAHMLKDGLFETTPVSHSGG